MKSRISLFDKGICKNFLRRFWPLWVAYLVVALFMLGNTLSANSWNYEEMHSTEILLESGIWLVYVSCAASALSALAVFGFMYNQRSCGMICSMPLRRETIFCTACVTGLAPLFLADIIVFVLAELLLVGKGLVAFGYLAQWLAIVLMGNTAFFGFAVFCSMLTGNAVMMPVVYLLLNVAAYVAETTVKTLLSIYIYGFAYLNVKLEWLSPIINIGNLRVDAKYEMQDNMINKLTGYSVRNMDMLIGYCIAGIVLMFLALLLFRRRSMESAGDVVAVRVLRPIFKYCMAFGVAVVFAVVVNSWVLGNMNGGGFAAVLLTALMLVGAFIGYYASEMLMQKSLSVFRGRNKGFAVVCAVLVLTAICCETDVLGYERTTPDSAEVESISADFIFLNGEVKEPETIESIVALHRQITSHKAQNESANVTYPVELEYTMKNGKHINRRYEIAAGDEALGEPNSDIMLLQDICNNDELRALRTSFKLPVSPETIGQCNVHNYYVDSINGYQSESFQLSGEQVLELYNQCILPDVKDRKMADFWIIECGDYYDVKSNTIIYIELINRDYKEGDEGNKYEGIEYNVQMDSERCIKWLKENLGIEPISLRQAEPGVYMDKVAADEAILAN